MLFISVWWWPHGVETCSWVNHYFTKLCFDGLCYFFFVTIRFLLRKIVTVAWFSFSRLSCLSRQLRAKYIPLVYEALLDHLILIQPNKTFPLLWKGVANHPLHRHRLFYLVLRELNAVNNHPVTSCFSKTRFPSIYA